MSSAWGIILHIFISYSQGIPTIRNTLGFAMLDSILAMAILGTIPI